MSKILVVDDSETLRTQLQTDLAAAGYQVVLAADGFEGLDALRAHPDIKLIFCDVNMPKMDGFEMCERMLGMEIFKGIPILMLTTESSPEMKVRGKQVGVTAWITKPYIALRMLAAVRKLVAA